MQTYIHLLILLCKILVGNTQTLELHRTDAGCAIAEQNAILVSRGNGKKQAWMDGFLVKHSQTPKGVLL